MRQLRRPESGGASGTKLRRNTPRGAKAPAGPKCSEVLNREKVDQIAGVAPYDSRLTAEVPVVHRPLHGRPGALGQFSSPALLIFVLIGNCMMSDHPVSSCKGTGPSNGLIADNTDAVAMSIARLTEENEALRRLVAFLTSELEVARGIGFDEGSAIAPVISWLCADTSR